MENFKNFMLNNLKEEAEREILVFPGIKTFLDENGNPIPLKFKKLTKSETRNIEKEFKTTTLATRNDGTYIISRGGKVAVVEDTDFEGLATELIAKTMVCPNLKDKELLEFYGVYAATELVPILFKGEDYTYVDQCAAQAAGIIPIDEDKIIKEIKN